MKTQRLAIALTVINLLILMPILFRASSATTPEIAPVLRGRALEIVDEQGRIRAMLKVLPADPKVKMPDGTVGFPESVLFRLINSKGAPNVKIGATEDGAGMSLVSDPQPAYVQILTRGTNISMTLLNKDGQKQWITAR